MFSKEWPHLAIIKFVLLFLFITYSNEARSNIVVGYLRWNVVAIVVKRINIPPLQVADIAAEIA